MKTISTTTIVILLSWSSVFAEPEHSTLAEYEDWSLFYDGEVCWIESFSAEPFLQEDGPRLTVTFYGDDYEGDLTVFDPKNFYDADLIALVIEGRAFPLDREDIYSEYVFDNTSGLMGALNFSEAAAVDVKLIDQSNNIVNYRFSLDGYASAAKSARKFCEKPV